MFLNVAVACLFITQLQHTALPPLSLFFCLQDLFLPWYNALRFFTQNANRPADSSSGSAAAVSAFVADPSVAAASTNAMDRWIYAAVQGLIAFVRAEMGAYRLYTVVPRLVRFIRDLTNWCVAMLTLSYHYLAPLSDSSSTL